MEGPLSRRKESVSELVDCLSFAAHRGSQQVALLPRSLLHFCFGPHQLKLHEMYLYSIFTEAWPMHTVYSRFSFSFLIYSDIDGIGIVNYISIGIVNSIDMINDMGIVNTASSMGVLKKW